MRVLHSERLYSLIVERIHSGKYKGQEYTDCSKHSEKHKYSMYSMVCLIRTADNQQGMYSRPVVHTDYSTDFV